MFMSASLLRRYIEPISQLESVESIRIGTKSLAYWPQKFVTDPDADETLRLFERIVKSGKNVAFMAHFSHPRELETPMVREAVQRIRNTGATIRTQAPLIRTINDDASNWSSMWRNQVRLGMIPYYMFVERDTGPHDYFAMPLEKAYEIYTTAYRNVSGLARTVRGPSMSASAGKVCIDGIVDIAGEKVFALNFIRCRDPQLENQPFFAKFDPKAVWLSDLKPAFGADFPFDVE
jgi:L-lysine 2,3-aminomutase